MPVFVAALAAAALFCLSVPLLNGITRLVLWLHLAPLDLAENGFLQYGLALALAGVLWRKAIRLSPLSSSTGIGNARVHETQDRPSLGPVENVAILWRPQEPYP